MSRAMRRIYGLLVAVGLVVGSGVVLSPAHADSAVPWTWRHTTVTSNLNGSFNASVTATCPSGSYPISGGWSNSGDASWTGDVYVDNTYTAHFFNGNGTVTVTVLCVAAKDYDVRIEPRTLSIGDSSLAYADLTCNDGERPVAASFSSNYLLYSGPETVGGVDKWFVGAENAANTTVKVNLRCVPSADLAGTTYVSSSVKNTTGDDATLSAQASCPAGERILTGGTHVDSLDTETRTSGPVDTSTWQARMLDVPDGDTLTTRVLCAPDGNPTATILTGPTNPTNDSTPTFTFTGSDPADIGWGNWCFADQVFLGGCSDSYTFPSPLTEGQHVFSLETVTSDGRGGASTEADRFFYVDLTAPTIALKPMPLYSLTRKLNIRAHGADDYEFDHDTVDITRQGFTGGPATTTHQTTTTGKVSLKAVPGTTYTVNASATDTAGNVSGAIPAVRTAVPLDDLALKASRHWQVIRAKGYYRGVVSRTTHHGATLSKKVTAKQVALVATTCPQCGKVKVLAGKKVLRTLDLHSKRTLREQVLTLPALASPPKQTTITIKVVSRGKRVEIDGLGVLN